MSNSASETEKVNGAVADGEKKEELPTLLPFIEQSVRTIPAARLELCYRITPRGLFVGNEARDEILSLYQNWFTQHTNGEAKVSEHKAIKRLFGSEEPEQLYLPEGKRCLIGFMLSCPIPNPANYRVPYYLGTPFAAADNLFASDPIFSELTGVRSEQGREGLNIIIKAKNHDYILPLPGIKVFKQLASSSTKLHHEFPRCEQSLSETVRTLYYILPRARYIKPQELPLLPLRWKKEYRNISCLSWGGFYLLFDKGGYLLDLFHTYGKNFYIFMRDEIAFQLSKEQRGQLGSFEIYPRKHEFVGSLIVNGKRLQLHGHALTGFISAQLEDQSLAPNSSGPLTLRTYTEYFINTIQLAQQSSAALLMPHIPPQYRRGYNFLLNKSWIFIISNQGVIEATTLRGAKEQRETRRPRGRR